MLRELRCLAACACVALSLPVAAGSLSVEECFEGSDFIANAARARENGMSRGQFIGRMQDDFALIHAYPPALRWFAQDEEDERFLLEAAQDVFDRPDTPDQHRTRFLEACFARASV